MVINKNLKYIFLSLPPIFRLSATVFKFLMIHNIPITKGNKKVLKSHILSHI